MTWLGGKRIAVAVIDALGLVADDAVLVGFDGKLAARLAAAGMRATFTSDVERDLARATTPTIPFGDILRADEPFSAAVTVGAAARTEHIAALVSALGGATRPRGRVALIDRVKRTTATRAAMLGGLSRIEQTTVGRYVITSGEVVAL